MKKAVIEVGGTQYLVAEGDTFDVNFLGSGKKTVDFQPLMIVDGDSSVVDPSKLKSAKVTAKIAEEPLQGEKVIALRYKAKKRVHTKRGHRQKLSRITVTAV